MLTKDDLIKLSKDRLCDLLLEEWNKKELPKSIEIQSPNDVYNGGRDCYHGEPSEEQMEAESSNFYNRYDSDELYSRY